LYDNPPAQHAVCIQGDVGNLLGGHLLTGNTLTGWQGNADTGMHRDDAEKQQGAESPTPNRSLLPAAIQSRSKRGRR